MPMSILQDDAPVSSFCNRTMTKRKLTKTTGVSALSSSLKVWQLWRLGGRNDRAYPTASLAMSYICLRVCVACICIYIIYIYIVYLYLYTSDDADMSASIHIYNICIGSRFLKILVRRRLPLRFV